MKRIIWLVALMLSPEVPLLAQGLPNGVARSVDTFTGDTVWETKYGRLDDTHGCIREALAIIWKLVRGPSGRTEWLTLSTGDIPVPRAMINVDGRIIEGHEEQLLSGPKNAHLTYLLPDSALRLVADAKVVKLRLGFPDGRLFGTPWN